MKTYDQLWNKYTIYKLGIKDGKKFVGLKKGIKK